jgi:hypothetical protein
MKTQVMIFAILVILTAGVGFDIFTRHTSKPDDLWQHTVISLAGAELEPQTIDPTKPRIVGDQFR